MNHDDSKISVKPVAKLSDKLSNQTNSLNKKQRLANLAKLNNLAKMSVKGTNSAYQAAVSRSTKFPIDELQRRVLGKLRKTYSEQAYKDLVINLGYLPAFERLDWLKVMDDKLRRKN